MNRIFKTFSVILLISTSLMYGCKEKEIAEPASLKPIKITFDDFLSGKYIDQTVQIEDVFFIIDKSDPVGHLFNGTTSNGTGTRILSNCKGQTLDVFTSSDRDFAYMKIPTGMGTITGVASEFGGNKQLLIRYYEDVENMTGAKCEVDFPTFTIAQVLAGEVEIGATVRIENVEFSNITDTWGGPRTIKDCFGNTMLSYVPSSASFANNTVPPGNGPLFGVIDLFNTTWEIKPTSLEDGAGMVNPLCGGTTPVDTGDCDVTPTTTYLSKDFEDASLTSGGWINEVVVGTTNWTAASFSGDNYAKISNFANSVNTVAESWFISPSTSLASATAPELIFKNLAKFNGDPLKVMISTDYAGSGDPNSATWTDLTSQATWDVDLADWGTFVCSGNINLSSYVGSSVYIGFKYTGSASDGTTWELDNILIKE